MNRKIYIKEIKITLSTFFTNWHKKKRGEKDRMNECIGDE